MAIWYKTGTVDVTQSSKNVTGTGTSWKTDPVGPVSVGDLFTYDGSKFYEVENITSDTALVLNITYAETTAAGVVYGIVSNLATTTNAALASRVSSLVSGWQTREDEMIAWLGDLGTTTVTDNVGTVHIVKTLRQIENDYRSNHRLFFMGQI